MSARSLWGISVPLAILAWAGIIAFTASMPPGPLARMLFLPLLTLAATMTSAPAVWTLARGLRLAGTGERPALALRAALWVGLWVTACAGLQLYGSFNWVVALTLATVLALLESFLLQLGRQQAGRHRT